MSKDLTSNSNLSSGVVKCVLSGDTIIVRGRPVNGPPPERTLALSGLTAPRFSAKNESEPFAFQSREFLRKLLVGKNVRFQIEYTSQSGREYATIFTDNVDSALGDGFVNVAQLILLAGWAKINASASFMDPLFAEYESKAKSASIGIWNAESDTTPQIKYSLSPEEAAAYAPKTAKTKKTMQGIVEQVRDGTTMRILLLPDFQMAVCNLAGIKSPVYRKDVPGVEDLVEPFAEEAKYFTETRLLQRQVEVVIGGVSNQNLIVTVNHPAGSIADNLIQNGLARIVDWSIAYLSTSDFELLKKSENLAKNKRIRIWHDYKPPSFDQNGSFPATVIRIITGDTLLVEYEEKLQVKQLKVTLSSVRQPNPQTESNMAFEAKEFLRKKLIGKKVNVEIDYRKPPFNGSEERICATITQGNMIVSEAMVAKGLLYLLRHKQDDNNRSRVYDRLVLAESKAKEAKLGVNNSEQAQQQIRISDASENVAKARSFLPFFKRAGRISGVVEHVVSGSKFKIFIPKDNTKLTFALTGIRVPRSGGKQGNNEVKPEPFGNEALALAEKKCLQRDVEIEIESIDKSGAFVGTLWLNRSENFTVSLLEEGLAYVFGSSADNSPYANEIYQAENRARSAVKNVWSVYTETKEEEAVEVSNEIREVIITEVVDGVTAYAQFVTKDLKTLKEIMKEIEVTIKTSINAPLVGKPRVGDLLAARFTADNAWYRAKIKKVISNTEFEVMYIDYGNSEVVPMERLYRLDPNKFMKLPGQANEIKLSYLISPAIDHEYGIESAEYFKNLVNRPNIKAYLDMRIGSSFSVTLFDADEVPNYTPAVINMSINAKMLKQGYAQIDKRKKYKEKDAIALLLEQEQHARMNRLGMYEYGDFDLIED